VREFPAREIFQAKRFHSRVQSFRPTVIVLKLVQIRKRGIYFGRMHRPEAWKQGFFFIGSVLGSGFAKVTKRRFQGAPGLLRRRRIQRICHRPKRSHEHLYAAMAIRQQACGIVKTSRRVCNLNRHTAILPASRMDRMIQDSNARRIRTRNHLATFFVCRGSYVLAKHNQGHAQKGEKL
jgi:hypothetical protein